VAEKSRPGPIFAFISPEGLQTLLQYKYVSGQYSIGDKAMQPFWNWFVTLMPISMAPNLITLLGLIGNLFSLAVCLLYDVSYKEAPPMWLSLLIVATMFIY